MDLIPLRVYGTGVEAQLAKSLLESHGLKSHVDDMDLLQSALGRVTLYVASEDVDQARRLLGEEDDEDVTIR